MTRVHVDATTLIAFGRVGELALLTNFEGDVVVHDEVRAEVTTEPAQTNVERFCDSQAVLNDEAASPPEAAFEDARTVLDAEGTSGDVALVAAVLTAPDDEPAGIVSDDARVRTITDGLDATVTGTVGVVVRAVEEGMDVAEGKELIRRLDDHGLHMTGELRETALRLVEEASEGE